MVAAVVGVVVLGHAVSARDYRVTVAPAQMMAFALPSDAPRPAVGPGPAGVILPVQTGSGGEAGPVLPAQRAGETVVLALGAACGRGIGIRRADAWSGPGDAALFLTSEGISDRVAGNNTRGRWCFLGGRIDGAIAGTAVLGHPDNFRAPQPLRLHPNMPYFSYVPQQLGEFAIEPGKPYVARFRFVAADGAPDRARLDAFWQGYARPAIVSLAPAP